MPFIGLLVFTDPPLMDCDTKHRHLLGTKDAKIVCKARMNPAPDTAVWSWGKKANKTVLETGETLGKFKAEQSVSLHRLYGEEIVQRSKCEK